MNDNIIIRKANFSDELQVIELWKRNNLINKNPKNNWKMIWIDNPFYQENFPIGWVIESENKILGYIGNIPLIYHFNNKKIRAVAARGFVVDKKARNYSLKLVSYFFSQKNIDLFLITTSNESASNIYSKFGAQPLPLANYKSIFYWITNIKDVLKNILINKLKIPKTLSNIITFFLYPFCFIILTFAEKYNYKNKKQWNGEIKFLSINDISEEFNDFWIKTKTNSNMLLADRSLEVLKWHYKNTESIRDNIKVISAYLNNKLVGYAFINIENLPNSNTFKRIRIIDLITIDDNISIVNTLIFKVIEFAKTQNVHSVMLVGLPEHLKNQVLNTKPLIRKLKYMPFWFMSLKEKISSDLSHKENWYPVHYDGDSNL